MKTVFVMLCLFVSNSFADASVYVQSMTTKLKSEAKAGSADVTSLKRGDELKVLSTEGSWLKVEFNKQTGYISKLFVSNIKPATQNELMNADQSSAEKTSRKRSSSFAVSAATRGLSAGSRHRDNRENYRSDAEAVDKIEKQQVHPQDLKKFQKEGAINGESSK